MPSIEKTTILSIIENVVTGLLGVALLAASIYVRVNYDTFSAFASLEATYIAIAAGALLVVISIFGCFAASKRNRNLLIIYSILSACVLALTAAAAILGMTLSVKLNSISSASFIPAAIVDSTAISIYNTVLSSYVSCCEGCVPAQACTNPNVPLEPLGTEYCPLSACSAVGICTSETTGCFSSGTTVIPPYVTSNSTCVFLTTMHVSVNGVTEPIVGPASLGSCGGGDPAQYTSDVIGKFNGIFYDVAIAFCVIAGVELLTLLTAIYLTCVVHRQDQDAP